MNPQDPITQADIETWKRDRDLLILAGFDAAKAWADPLPQSQHLKTILQAQLNLFPPAKGDRWTPSPAALKTLVTEAVTAWQPTAWQPTAWQPTAWQPTHPDLSLETPEIEVLPPNRFVDAVQALELESARRLGEQPVHALVNNPIYYHPGFDRLLMSKQFLTLIPGQKELQAFPWPRVHAQIAVHRMFCHLVFRALRKERGDRYFEIAALLDPMQRAAISHSAGVRAQVMLETHARANRPEWGLTLITEKASRFWADARQRLFFLAQLALSDQLGTALACLADTVLLDEKGRPVITLFQEHPKTQAHRAELEGRGATLLIRSREGQVV